MQTFNTIGVQSIVKEGQAVLTVRSDASVWHASRTMRHHRVGCLVVIDDHGSTVGIVTERDLVHKVMAESKDPQALSVAEIMTRDVISVGPHTSVTEALMVMARHGIRHLPVIDDGLLLGVVSNRDILHHQVSTVKSLLRRHMSLVRSLEEEIPDSV